MNLGQQTSDQDLDILQINNTNVRFILCLLGFLLFSSSFSFFQITAFNKLQYVQHLIYVRDMELRKTLSRMLVQELFVGIHYKHYMGCYYTYKNLKIVYSSLRISHKVSLDTPTSNWNVSKGR